MKEIVKYLKLIHEELVKIRELKKYESDRGIV